MQTRKLGRFEVSAIGLGCMSLSHAYGSPPPREQAERVLKGALDAGYTFLDTAAVYGVGHNETLVGEVLKDRRQDYVLASKCGLTNGDVRELNGRPEVLKATCEGSLKRLQTDVIDLYYLHRFDRQVPIEDSVGAMADLVAAGKVRTLGLSEVSADTLRKAHAVHPIAALQNEYSLWSRNPEQGTLAAAAELGVALVAFSPLARGFLTAAPPDPAALPEKDIRRNMPRFAADNYAANLLLHARIADIARDAGCTPAQLALAWVLSRGEHVVAIPGTRSIAHLRENMAALELDVPAAALEEAGQVLNAETVHGPRYNDATLAEIDTERCGNAG